jgi:PEP-CTERM motif
MVKRLLGIGAIALLTFVILAPQASADDLLIAQGRQIDFMGGAGGTVSFKLGLGNSLNVTGAPINNLVQFPSFLNFPVVGGLLNLSTGPCESGCTKFNKGSGTSTLFFDDGGSLSIVGEIPSIGINTMTTLITGFFDSNGIENHEANASLNSKTHHGGIDGYLDISFIDPTIVQALNLLGGNGHGYISEMLINLSFNSDQNSWNGSINSTDLDIKPTPEPGSLFLLGSSLLGAAGILRRKFASKA